MAQLMTKPMMHRAIQAGATNHWRYDQGALANAVGEGVELAASGSLGQQPGFPTPWEPDGGYLDVNAYLYTPADTRLDDQFSVFGQFTVYPQSAQAGTPRRTLLSVLYTDGVSEGGDLREISVSVQRSSTSGMQAVITHYFPDIGPVNITHDLGPADMVLTVYACIQSTPTGARVILLTPGRTPIMEDIDQVGAPLLPGFCGAPVTTTIGYAYPFGSWSRERNFVVVFSNLCTFSRQVTLAELFGWSRLMELGQSSDGILLPENNARSAISAGYGLAAEDTLLTLGDDAAKFSVPGPFEEGRVTLVAPTDSSDFEVCALVANDFNQLELRRGEEGTVAKQWPAGTLVRGFLTNDQLRPNPLVLPRYSSARKYTGYGVPWVAVTDAPDFAGQIATLVTSIDGLAQSLNITNGEVVLLKNKNANLTSRIVELEARPSREDYDALAAEIAALKLRVKALEGGDVSDEFLLVDAQGNVLTDANGTALSAPGSLSPITLVDAAGDVLVDANGVPLEGQDMRLVDSGGTDLVDTDGAQLIAA